MLANIDEKENLARMERGELYHAFSPQLVAARKRCGRLVGELNRAGELSRRELATYWKKSVMRPCLDDSVLRDHKCSVVDTSH